VPYCFKFVRINLENNSIKKEIIEEKEAKLFLGGRGFAAYILSKEVPAGIDPLSSNNKLIFATGPLNFLPMVGTCRYQVAAKSPLTGIYGEANSGGKWAQILKRTGLDGLVIEGKSEKLVYLWITDKEVKILDASELAFLTTYDTEKRIKEISGDSDISIASIGPAGEKMIPIACIINDKYHAAGRCGLGAVMGSKNLKAIAVQSNKKVVFNNPTKVKEWTKRLWEKYYSTGSKILMKYGTSRGPALLNSTGELPTKNFRSSYFSGADKISSNDSYDFKSESCYACPIKCKKYIRMDDNNYYKAPEYETAAAFGSLCMVDDYQEIIKANKLCNEAGLDTISTGVIIAFAMECFESGILKESDLDGLNLTWGNAEAMCKLITKIANKEGIGILLGKGVRYSAKKIGKGSEKFAAHVKGLEIPMHTPRIKKGLALSYLTSVRGACHMQSAHDQDYEQTQHPVSLGISDIMSRHQVEGKANMVKITQDYRSLLECLVVCKFVFNNSGSIGLDEISNLLNDTIGLRITQDELMMVGERIHNLCRLLGVREGVSRKDDFLPKRFTERIIDGPEKGKYISQNVMSLLLDEYYLLRGWDTQGIPKEKKLMDLNLEEAANLRFQNF